MSSLLTVEQLTKKYGTTTAVDHVSFALAAGEIVGLLGANGAGKTTTINMLLGVLTATAGTISFFGKHFLKHRAEVLEQVGFASTYLQLPAELTVYENLDLYGRLYGLSSVDRIQRIEQLLREVELWEFRHRFTGTLSSGQAARIMMIKAFIHYPRIVLLDEPTAALDPDFAHTIRRFILRMQREHGIAVLLTSHNMEEVAEVSDRVLVLKQGRIIADDSPEVLAATVAKARVVLVVSHGLELIQRYAQEHNIACKINNNIVECAVDEHQISLLLADLAQSGVHYTHIALEKPTLEDYFLTIASGGK